MNCKGVSKGVSKLFISKNIRYISTIVSKLYMRILDLSLKSKLLMIIIGISVVTPTVLVAMFVSVYYYLGIERFFSEEIDRSLQETVKIVHLYMDEHINGIKMDALSLVNRLDNLPNILNNQDELNIFLENQASEKGFTEIIIFDESGQVIGKTAFSLSVMFDDVSYDAMRDINAGEIYVRKNNATNKVQAILKIQEFSMTLINHNLYLLVGRYVDPNIIQYLHNTENSANSYQITKQQITKIRNRVIVSFVLLSVFLTFVAILITNKISVFITRPVVKLANAAAIIKSGNYGVTVDCVSGNDEISMLTKVFNSMSDKIARQHSELAQFNLLLDQKRIFMEAVLSELSSGVIAFDVNGFITLSNNAASKILDVEKDFAMNQIHYLEFFPEIKGIIEDFWAKKERVGFNLDKAEENIADKNYHINKIDDNFAIHNISIVRKHRLVDLVVRVGVVYSPLGESIENIVLAFEDVSELLIAQKTKAWNEVARRIAHEIKNPLTPIWLAVERIENRFAPSDPVNKELFTKYTKTILRRVEDIKSMLSDLLDFGKIPSPRFLSCDICLIVSEVILLEQAANPKIEYRFESDARPCYVLCDNVQIRQVLTNVLKNSAESINQKDSCSSKNYQGEIIITISSQDKKNLGIIIKVEDNGMGVDAKFISNICDPYVTTKKGGRGLGLAVVKKIIDEHRGKMSFSISNREQEGAVVMFSLSPSEQPQDVVNIE